MTGIQIELPWYPRGLTVGLGEDTANVRHGRGPELSLLPLPEHPTPGMMKYLLSTCSPPDTALCSRGAAVV